MTPTCYDVPVDPGDEWDPHDTPVCCDADMTAVTDADTVTHTCGTCATRVLVRGGLVADVHTPATEDTETIRLTADVVVTTPAGRVLLIERGWDPYAGHWALPGGHIDAGETAPAAAARELAEETGVHVDPADLVEIGTWHAPGRDPRGRYVTIAYRAVVPDDTPAAAADDAHDARWWPLNALPERLAFDHADILRRAAGTPAALTTT